MGRIKLRDEVICLRPSESQELNLFRKAHSGAPAKRHQYLWPVYLKCFPVTNDQVLQVAWQATETWESFIHDMESHPVKPMNYLKNTSLSFQLSSQMIACRSINEQESSRIIFIMHRCLLCPFSPCNRVVLSSLPAQLQRQENNLSIK